MFVKLAFKSLAGLVIKKNQGVAWLAPVKQDDFHKLSNYLKGTNFLSESMNIQFCFFKLTKEVFVQKRSSEFLCHFATKQVFQIKARDVLKTSWESK